MISASSGRGRMTVVVLGWLVSAGVAVVVGLGAIDALGSGIVGPASPPLSASDVQRQLATLSPSPSAAPSSTSTAPTSAAAATTSPPVSGPPASQDAQLTSAPGPADSAGSGSGSGAGDESGTDPQPPTSSDLPASDPPPPPDDEGITEVTPTDGGTVISTCRSGLATIDSATPAQGFVKENVEVGPDKQVGIRFESDSVRVDVSVTCGRDGPVVDVDTDRDR